MQTQPEKPTILFLFSDTGGGHRSATEAIIESLSLEFGDTIQTEMVDIFKQYTPHPLHHLPDLYPKIVRVPQAWGLGYRLSDGHRRARLITASAWPYVRRSIRALVQQHPSNLIVSTHPLANAPVLKALGQFRPPFITVVTDLVTTHALWFHRRADLTIVPTTEARRRAIGFGLKPGRVLEIGLPVAERFSLPPKGKKALRAQFGWPTDRPLVLLVGGGEGMGPLEKTARAIDANCHQATLVVIAGRNQALKARLEDYHWSIPTFIYGFVREMPDFMSAADILVTKAGPGTISEALISGLPMVLYSRLPGQEDGNVTYIVTENAGVWAPQSDQTVSAINTWIENPEQRLRAVAACRKLARPNASREISHILAEAINKPEGVVRKENE